MQNVSRNKLQIVKNKQNVKPALPAPPGLCTSDKIEKALHKYIVSGKIQGVMISKQNLLRKMKCQ